MDQTIAFQGELQMLGWSESDRGGRVVKFQCSGDEQEHPFKAFRKGARFAVVLVEIGDDEKPVMQPWIPGHVSLPGGSDRTSNVCARLCKDRDFWTWLEGRVWGVPITNEQKAAELVKEFLGIESRAELDDDIQLAGRFRDEIYAPFRAWQQTALRVRSA